VEIGLFGNILQYRMILCSSIAFLA